VSGISLLCLLHVLITVITKTLIFSTKFIYDGVTVKSGVSDVKVFLNCQSQVKPKFTGQAAHRELIYDIIHFVNHFIKVQGLWMVSESRD
jgi:hypothetical protein